MDIFVTFHADYDDYGILYVGTDLNKALEVREKLTDERTKLYTDVEVWRDGVRLFDINSVEQYSHLSQTYEE